MVRGVKVALVIIIFILSIFQAVFLLYESAHMQEKIQAMAVQGVVSFCINYPPNVSQGCLTDINQSTAIENNTYTCQINGTAQSGTPINYSFDNASVPSILYFDMNSSGYLFVNTNHSGIGNHIIPIQLTDTSVCPMSKTYNYNLTVHDINDPPTLIRLIPSKVIPGKTSILPFYLRSFFMDLDGDNISYSTSPTTKVNVSIDSSTTLVTIASLTEECAEDQFYFIATDEHNLSTDSNTITITISCPAPNIESSGGGRGGARWCEPLWECKEWGICLINNSQSRLCVDLHACDPSDYEKYFWRDCFYVPTCYDGVKNQLEEGIDCGGPCVPCKINMTGVPTCEDGIRNQGELGIDCGGPCPACKQIEVPAILEEESGSKMMTIIMIIVLALVALSVVYIIFRKEIKTIFAKIAWWLIKRRKKQILLTDAEREELLSMIKPLEGRISKAEDIVKINDKIFQDFLDISRLYLNYILKTQSFTETDVEKGLEVVKNNSLKKALRIFIERHVTMETSEVDLDKYLLMYYMQDLRQVVLNTSNYSRKDFTFTAKALPVEGIPIEECKNLLYNATIALEFLDIDSAKDCYFELLKLYELLDESGKEVVFYELSKLFNYIKYVLSWG